LYGHRLNKTGRYADKAGAATSGIIAKGKVSDNLIFQKANNFNQIKHEKFFTDNHRIFSNYNNLQGSKHTLAHKRPRRHWHTDPGWDLSG
jgi:hypothetical protein